MSGCLCLRLGSCTDRVVYIPQHTAIQDTQTPEKKTTLQLIAIFWVPLYIVQICSYQNGVLFLRWQSNR